MNPISGRCGSVFGIAPFFLSRCLLFLFLGYSTIGSAAAPTEVEMVAIMEQHYNAAISSHDALIEGDIATLQASLRKIEDMELPATAPSNWRLHHHRLRKAAKGAAEVTDLDSAAHVMALVAEACGFCHTALGVGKIYFWPAPPDGDEKLKTAMRTHQWASERLWEGITGPFPEAWERGAASLAEAKVFADSVKQSLKQRESALRELGQEAKTATVLHDRAAIYARFLTTCAACHQEAGVSIKRAKSVPPWQK